MNLIYVYESTYYISLFVSIYTHRNKNILYLNLLIIVLFISNKLFLKQSKYTMYKIIRELSKKKYKGIFINIYILKKKKTYQKLK